VSAAEFGGAIDNTAILEFVDAGHDVLIAVDAAVSNDIRELVADLGVDVDAKGSTVVDHVHQTSVDHTTIYTSEWVDSSAILGSKPEASQRAIPRYTLHLFFRVCNVIERFALLAWVSSGTSALQGCRFIHPSQQSTGKGF
jgi:Oligosaccharyltransferase 48 kDa subunit beta